MKKQVLLIIGYVWPEPNSSAAGYRMMQLINLFKQASYHIVFACPAADSEFMADLESIGVERVKIVLNHSSFDYFVADLNPAIVLFDRFMMEEQFGWRVAEFCKDAIRILDTEDLHSLRKARQYRLKTGLHQTETNLMNDTAKREIASILRCDCSLIISEYEMNLLVQTYQLSPQLLYYLPLLFEPKNTKDLTTIKTYEERNHFVFMGNFFHEPNKDAVLFLKSSIWPSIRKKLPQAELHIYGAYATQQISMLQNTSQGFIIKGRADSAATVYENAKVSLAPLQFGAGLKGKVLESMHCGTPVVCTTIAAEGIQIENDYQGMVADEMELFVNCAVKVYTNQAYWQKVQGAGYQIINEQFNLSSFEHSFLQYINWLKINVGSNRNRNFMGALLMQQTTTASKYMSKWIEEKNKNL